MATPRTATSTKVAAPTALGSHDIGTRATTSLELLTGILYSLSFCAVTPSTTFPLPLRGDVSALVYFDFLSSLTVRDAPVVHDATATTAGGVLEYTCYTQLDYDRDRIRVLYSKSMPCLVFQVGLSYVYIYSPERLNNTSIIFRNLSSPILLQKLSLRLQLSVRHETIKWAEHI
jgi:hypothetical protein